MLQSSVMANDIKPGAAVHTSGTVSIVAASQNFASQSWILDSGASFHVTSDKSKLVACKPVTNATSVHTADGTSCHVTHQGSLHSPYFYIPDVSCVPQLSMNLLSVGQIADMNCFVGFDDSSCFIQDRQSGSVIGTGHRRRDSSNLYVLDTLHLPSSTARVISCVIIRFIFRQVASSSWPPMWVSIVYPD